MTETTELKGLQLNGRARVFGPLLKQHNEDEVRRIAIRAPKDAAEALTQLFSAYEEQGRDLVDLSVSDFVRDLRTEADTAKTELAEARKIIAKTEERHQQEIERARAQYIAQQGNEVERAVKRANIAEEKLDTHRRERDEALRERDKLSDALALEQAERGRLQGGIVKSYEAFSAFMATIEGMPPPEAA